MDIVECIFSHFRFYKDYIILLRGHAYVCTYVNYVWIIEVGIGVMEGPHVNCGVNGE
jgi:hypothetical protein